MEILWFNRGERTSLDRTLSVMRPLKKAPIFDTSRYPPLSTILCNSPLRYYVFLSVPLRPSFMRPNLSSLAGCCLLLVALAWSSRCVDICSFRHCSIGVTYYYLHRIIYQSTSSNKNQA